MYYSDYNRPPEDREPVIESNQYHVYEAQPQQKKKRGVGKIIAIALCCALLGGAAGAGGALAYGHFAGGVSTIYQSKTPTTAVSLANVDGHTVLTPEEIYASNLGAAVGVNGDKATTNVWGYTVKNAVSGSGFVISSNATTSYILTNYHVIDGVSDIKVFFADGKSYDATLVGGEQENDIAVLKIDAGNLPKVTLGDSDALNVGQEVYAIGNPLGELTFTFTGGYVSAKDRSVTMSDGTVMNMLQTDTAINSGNSGGPLFNEYGEVIGIVSAKLSSSSSSEATVEGLGFAIPINDVKDMVISIMEHGYVTGKPNVGVLLDNVSQEAQRYGVPAGAEIMAVLDGSGADKGGLQAGDIVTAVDGKEIDSVSALQEAVDGYKAGDSLTFTVYRDGEEATVTVTLDEDNQARQEAMDQLQQEYYEEQQAQQQQQQQQGGGNFFWPFGW